jgi:hypothetical integral membrane protein (TIGR02206 family)
MLLIAALLAGSMYLNEEAKKRMAITAGLALIVAELLFQPYLLYIHRWSIHESLPLHMCTMSAYFCGYALITRRQLAFEFAVYWGIPGGIHSLLTPEFTHGINHVLVAEYYLLHSGIVFAGLFLCLSMNMRLRPLSWWRIFLLTQVALPLIYLFNYATGANYMYLSRKPVADNPFLIGLWPVYIAVLELVALAHFYLLYQILKCKRQRLLRSLTFGCGVILKVLFYVCLNILPFPLILLSHLVYSRKIRRHIPRDPVFIIGHWRSGTTKLHALMVSNTSLGYLNFYKAVFPGHFLITEKFLKRPLGYFVRALGMKTPYFNKLGFDWDYPCEEDTALLNAASTISSYWAYIFPCAARRWFDKTLFPQGKFKGRWEAGYYRFVRKISFANEGRRLVLKSPGNISRIDSLLKLFPAAAFIYIHRDPCDVYYSHFKLWEQNIKMFSLQQIPNADLQQIILDYFHKTTLRFETLKPRIPTGKLFTVSYDELMTRPRESLEDIRQALSLEQHFKALTDDGKPYQPFEYRKDAALCTKIREQNPEYCSQYGYESRTRILTS